jgi:hypothetical protein
MLLQLSKLCADADGRYASDSELIAIQTYLKTAKLRFSTYQKIQALEPRIIPEVLETLQRADPTLLKMGGRDVTPKWQRDTVRTLRYAATALLTDDPEIFRERMLLWFHSIMKSFGVEQSCEATYRTLQDVVCKTLTPEEIELFCPLLEMSRHTLGKEYT